jgi:hypothetical protein
MEIVANPYAATDDGCGVTASSIETWKGTRAMFGRFVEVRLGGPQEAQGWAYGRSSSGMQVFPLSRCSQDRTMSCGEHCRDRPARWSRARSPSRAKASHVLNAA